MPPANVLKIFGIGGWRGIKSAAFLTRCRRKDAIGRQPRSARKATHFESLRSLRTAILFGQARSAQCKQREPMAESNRASLVNITTEKREIVPFCVLEPPLSKMAFCLKIPKTRYLGLLANKVLERQWGRRTMSQQFSVETAVCTEYQRLLADCQRALEIWDEHRAEVCQSRLRGKEAGDELLRLQAKYARAYTVLQRHANNCLLCQLVSRIEGQVSENSSDALSGNEMYA